MGSGKFPTGASFVKTRCIESHLMSTKLNLVTPGSLVRPDPVGRLVRLVFGLLFLNFLWKVFQTRTDLLSSTLAGLIELSIGIVIALVVFNYVVNIGFSRDWRRIPQIVIALLFVLAALIGWLQYGSIWAQPMGAVAFVWLVYVYAHLSVSFLLSAILATPGCEMRAIPHLVSLITGRETGEHYCPGGPLHRIDLWEAGRR